MNPKPHCKNCGREYPPCKVCGRPNTWFADYCSESCAKVLREMQRGGSACSTSAKKGSDGDPT